MRIIDKNHDFYDYLQHVYPDTSIVFDRRDSFVLSKEIFCHDFLRYSYMKLGEKFFLKLQVCNTIWLFLGTIIEVKKNTIYDAPYIEDYSIELLATWKNYNLPRKLISLDMITFSYSILHYIWPNELADVKVDILTQAIDNQEYEVKQTFNKYTYYRDDNSTIEKHIPILNACGISEFIDPLDIYLAIEEYFSLEKQDGERTESVGLTNKEKIENHGFDTTTSFRGN